MCRRRGAVILAYTGSNTRATWATHVGHSAASGNGPGLLTNPGPPNVLVPVRVDVHASLDVAEAPYGSGAEWTGRPGY